MSKSSSKSKDIENAVSTGAAESGQKKMKKRKLKEGEQDKLAAEKAHGAEQNSKKGKKKIKGAKEEIAGVAAVDKVPKKEKKTGIVEKKDSGAEADLESMPTTAKPGTQKKSKTLKAESAHVGEDEEAPKPQPPVTQQQPGTVSSEDGKSKKKKKEKSSAYNDHGSEQMVAAKKEKSKKSKIVKDQPDTNTADAAIKRIGESDSSGEKPKKKSKGKKRKADGDTETAAADTAAGDGSGGAAGEPGPDKTVGASPTKAAPHAQKKRRLDGANGESGDLSSGEKQGTAAKAFQRVKADEWLGQKGSWDNSYVGTFGENGWGFKAQQILGQVRGKDFRHEKTKKKRGSYKGGLIDTGAVCSYKFDSDDE